uniref:Uncharacterized protein n=1 Tax=Leersia perrieri TaxID=77586 RepID=A0A0D9VG43_9ORYZ
MASPPLSRGPGAPSQRPLLLQAAADGDLRLFKRIASTLDGGKGRLREVVEALKERGGGALHRAAGNGMTAVCAYLVEELQVDIDADDDSGHAPLSYAVCAGFVHTVSYLLDHGANSDKPGENGCTALHLAVEEGDCEMVKLLLMKGADVDSSCSYVTPLHVAALKNQAGAMKILLDYHADAGADIKGVGTYTPLVVAAIEGLTDFYECLMEAGADPDVPDENRRRDVEILLPVTSRIPSVHDWSVDGIITHVNRNVEDDPVYRLKPAELKLEASRAYKRKDYVTATKLYSVALNHDPEDATLYSNRSICWLKMDEGMNALLDAQVCRTMRSDWPKACYREGAVHMFLKDYEKACDAFLDGLKLEPGNIEIENRLRYANI